MSESSVTRVTVSSHTKLLCVMLGVMVTAVMMRHRGAVAVTATERCKPDGKNEPM
jgi:hypothetical protein